MSFAYFIYSEAALLTFYDLYITHVGELIIYR